MGRVYLWLLLIVGVCCLHAETVVPSLKNKHVILMGAAGSGKGTLSQFLKGQGNYYSFSLGDAIRQEIANGTTIGNACKEDLAAGNLIPQEIGFALFDQHFQAAVKDHQLFIIDGMIQNQNYVDFFDRYIADNGLSDQFCYIYLRLDENIARERIAKRLVCPSCAQVYANKTTCDDCNQLLIVRGDDTNEKTVNKRLDRFFRGSEELPAAILLIDQYRGRNNFLEVDARQTQDALLHIYEMVFRD